MEAPEKIYLFENPIDGTPDYRWLSKKSCNDDIEYILKDAFIEEVCKYLQKEVVEDYAGVVWEGLIEDFKKHMEDSL